MSRPRSISVDDLLAMLPATRQELAVRTGLTMDTTTKLVRELHLVGWIHIARWRRSPNKGRHHPVFVAGLGRDAVCTIPHKTPAEMYATWKAKAIKTGTYDVRLAKWRTRHYLEKATKTPQHWASALGL